MPWHAPRAAALATIIAFVITAGPALAGDPEHELRTPAPRPVLDRSAAFEEPRGIIALRAALAAALLGNPELAAFGWEIRAREADALQAGLLPNPVASSEFEDFAGTETRRGWETTQTTLSLAQLVQLGGKRAKAHRVAKLGEELASWDYETARLRVLSETTKAFVRLLAIQDRVRLADELVRLAGRARETVAATVKAGAVSPVEEARAGVALSQAQVAATALRHDLLAARAALAANWGSRAPVFDAVTGDLAATTPPPPFDGILASIAHNPDLARWATEIEARQAVLSLEQARRVPDVTVRLGGRHYADTGDTALVAELAVPLQLFDRNQGAIGAAEARLRRANAEQSAATTSVRAQVVAAYESLRAAREQAETLRTTTLPEAQRLYDGAADAYTKGLFRYLEVLDAQRTLFELRGQYLDTLASYHAAAAELERLTGSPIDASPDGDQH